MFIKYNDSVAQGQFGLCKFAQRMCHHVVLSTLYIAQLLAL